MTDRSLILQDYLPYVLAITSNRVSRMVAGRYRSRFGLSIWEWRAIAYLGEAHRATALALGEATAMDKVTVSRAVRSLVDRELIRRLPNPDDRRSHYLELTQAGEDIYREIAPVALEAEADLLAGLPEEDIARLRDILARLRKRAEAGL